MAIRKKTASKKNASKKAPAKKSPAKKASSRSRAPSPAVRRSASLDTSREWSLEEVERHLPSVIASRVAALRDAINRAQSSEGLITLGSSYRTEDILAAAPGFAAGALLAIQQLGGPPPGLALELLPLLVHEARELARVNIAFEQQLRDAASEIAGRREQLKLANSRALRARRGVARTLLRNVLPQGAKQRAELERAAGKAPTPAATIASVRAVARILAELREDTSLAEVLDSYQYGDGFVLRLRTLADDIEHLAGTAAGLTPPQSVDQRALDRQDGLVLTLIRAIYVPLREAHDEGAAITLPPLGAIERLVIFSSSSDTDDEPESAEPAEASDPAAS